MLRSYSDVPTHTARDRVRAAAPSRVRRAPVCVAPRVHCHHQRCRPPPHKLAPPPPQLRVQPHLQAPPAATHHHQQRPRQVAHPIATKTTIITMVRARADHTAVATRANRRRAATSRATIDGAAVGADRAIVTRALAVEVAREATRSDALLLYATSQRHSPPTAQRRELRRRRLLRRRHLAACRT